MTESAKNVGSAEAKAPPPPPPTDKELWSVPWRFGVHTLVGILIFGIIAAAAVGLELGVKTLTKWGVGRPIIYGLTAAEYGVFGVDLVLFGAFLWRTARRTMRQL